MKSRELLSAGRPEDNSKTQSIDLQCCLTGRSRLRQIQAKIPNLRVDVSSFHRFDDAYCDIPGCDHDFSTKEPEFLNGEARRLHSRQPCVSLACMPDGASILDSVHVCPFHSFRLPTQKETTLVQHGLCHHTHTVTSPGLPTRLCWVAQ